MSTHGTISQETERAVEGWYVAFQEAILRNLPRRIPKEIALKLAGSGDNLSDALCDALISPRAIRRLLFNSRSYTIKINSSDGRTKEQMLAAGSYSSIPSVVRCSDIFPIRPVESSIEIEILEFDRNISSMDAINLAEKYGLQRPAYEHAFLFAEQHLAKAASSQAIVFLHESWEDPCEEGSERSRKVIVLRKAFGDRVKPELSLEIHSFDKPEWGNPHRYNALGTAYTSTDKYGPQLWEGHHRFAFVCPPGQ